MKTRSIVALLAGWEAFHVVNDSLRLGEVVTYRVNGSFIMLDVLGVGICVYSLWSDSSTRR